jgi:hypothetical protein
MVKLVQFLSYINTFCIFLAYSVNNVACSIHPVAITMHWVFLIIFFFLMFVYKCNRFASHMFQREGLYVVIKLNSIFFCILLWEFILDRHGLAAQNY